VTKNVIQAVLLVPTRELALQTAQVAKELGKHLDVQVMVTTGGTSLKDDIMRLHQPVHIVVATPGRLVDLASKGVAKLNQCTMLVMDEAGRVPQVERTLPVVARESRLVWFQPLRRLKCDRLKCDLLVS
jgi:ATP-dependent RNA helicase DDX6/DHH1